MTSSDDHTRKEQSQSAPEPDHELSGERRSLLRGVLLAALCIVACLSLWRLISAFSAAYDRAWLVLTVGVALGYIVVGFTLSLIAGRFAVRPFYSMGSICVLALLSRPIGEIVYPAYSTVLASLVSRSFLSHVGYVLVGVLCELGTRDWPEDNDLATESIGMLARLCAAAFDLAIIVMVAFLISAPWLNQFQPSPLDPSYLNYLVRLNVGLVETLVAGFVWVGYITLAYVWFEWLGSPGKSALNLCVRTAQGHEPTAAQRALRGILKALPLWLPLIFVLSARGLFVLSFDGSPRYLFSSENGGYYGKWIFRYATFLLFGSLALLLVSDLHSRCARCNVVRSVAHVPHGLLRRFDIGILIVIALYVYPTTFFRRTTSLAVTAVESSVRTAVRGKSCKQCIYDEECTGARSYLSVWAVRYECKDDYEAVAELLCRFTRCEKFRFDEHTARQTRARCLARQCVLIHPAFSGELARATEHEQVFEGHSTFRQALELIQRQPPDFASGLVLLKQLIQEFPESIHRDYYYGWAMVCAAQLKRYDDLVEYYTVMREDYSGQVQTGYQIRNWGDKFRQVRRLLEEATAPEAKLALTRLNAVDEEAERKQRQLERMRELGMRFNRGFAH